jgi:hypothetical protein
MCKDVMLVVGKLGVSESAEDSIWFVVMNFFHKK